MLFHANVPFYFSFQFVNDYVKGYHFNWVLQRYKKISKHYLITDLFFISLMRHEVPVMLPYSILGKQNDFSQVRLSAMRTIENIKNNEDNIADCIRCWSVLCNLRYYYHKKRKTKLLGEAQTYEVGPVPVRVTESHATLSSWTGPTTSTIHVIYFIWRIRRICLCITAIRPIAVKTPLLHVAAHVIQAQLVGCLGRNGMGG